MIWSMKTRDITTRYTPSALFHPFFRSNPLVLKASTIISAYAAAHSGGKGSFFVIFNNNLKNAKQYLIHNIWFADEEMKNVNISVSIPSEILLTFKKSGKTLALDMKRWSASKLLEQKDLSRVQNC